MIDFFQNALDGVLVGSLYVLLALGFNLTFGVMRRLNLAYGPTIMVGLFVGAWAFQRVTNVPLIFGVVVFGTIVTGIYVERLSFRFVPPSLALASMVSTFAIWMQLEEAVTLFAPSQIYALPVFMSAGPFRIGEFSFSSQLLVAFVIATFAATALSFLFYRTRWGTALRAISDQPEVAQQIGINVVALSAQAMVVASVLGGISGFLIGGIEQQVDPHFGLRVTLKGLIAMMLGGIGSMKGAVAGGVTLGLLESESAAYLGPEYRQLVDFAALFIVAVVRPQGLAAPKMGVVPDYC